MRTRKAEAAEKHALLIAHAKRFRVFDTKILSDLFECSPAIVRRWLLEAKLVKPAERNKR